MRPHGPLLISQEALPVERLLTLRAMSCSEYPMDWKQGSQLIESVDCRILWTQFLTLQMQMFHIMIVRIVRPVLLRLGACHIRGISKAKGKSNIQNTTKYAEYVMFYPIPPPARSLCTIIGPGGICESRSSNALNMVVAFPPRRRMHWWKSNAGITAGCAGTCGCTCSSMAMSGLSGHSLSAYADWPGSCSSGSSSSSESSKPFKTIC